MLNNHLSNNVDDGRFYYGPSGTQHVQVLIDHLNGDIDHLNGDKSCLMFYK